MDNKTMTNSSTKAREIAQAIIEYDNQIREMDESILTPFEHNAIDLIATALTEYGEVYFEKKIREVSSPCSFHVRSCPICLSLAIAEGYARGMKEAVQECVKTHAEGYRRGQANHEHNSMCKGCCEFTSGLYQHAKDEYRRGIEEAAKVACDTKIWDGGVVCAQIRALLPSEGKGERHE